MRDDTADRVIPLQPLAACFAYAWRAHSAHPLFAVTGRTPHLELPASRISNGLRACSRGAKHDREESHRANFRVPNFSGT